MTSATTDCLDAEEMQSLDTDTLPSPAASLEIEQDLVPLNPPPETNFFLRLRTTSMSAKISGLIILLLVLLVFVVVPKPMFSGSFFSNKRQQYFKCQWTTALQDDQEFLTGKDDSKSFPRSNFGHEIHMSDNGQYLMTDDGIDYAYWWNITRDGSIRQEVVFSAVHDCPGQGYLVNQTLAGRTQYSEIIETAMSGDGQQILMHCNVLYQGPNDTHVDTDARTVGVLSWDKKSIGSFLKFPQLDIDEDYDLEKRFQSRWVTLSGDGNSLAVLGMWRETVRVELTGWAVRTYRLNETTLYWKQYGNTLGLDLHFDIRSRIFTPRPHLALSQDGERLVISGMESDSKKRNENPFCFAQVFRVLVYEHQYGDLEDWWVWYNPITDWSDQSEAHPLYTTSPATIRSGYVAYGMPGHHRNGCYHEYPPGEVNSFKNPIKAGLEGKVGVLSIENATQVGQSLYGNDPLQLFGYSVDLAAGRDGTMRLVVGSLGGHGRVSVYEYDEVMKKWIQIVEDKVGNVRGDPIGGSVAIDSNGNGDGNYIMFGLKFGTEKRVYFYRLSCRE